MCEGLSLRRASGREGHSLMLEKVRLQNELIEAKNFLESVAEKAGDAISVVDLVGKPF